MARTRRKLAGCGRQRGQSLVEVSLVLPLILIFFLGLVEVGFGMYSYLRLATANRESVRLASRGRFTDEVVAQRVAVAGGNYQPTPGVTEPHLRLTGPDSNTGVIITHIDIPVSGSADDIAVTYYVTGTLALRTETGIEVRPITAGDGRIADMSAQELTDYLGFRQGVTAGIYDYRTAQDYEAVEVERYVIVETFYAHKLLLKGAPGVPDPLQLYFASTMREMRDSRLN